ncbi:DUF1684 domain-containing protein [Salinilacihabitans rarus]|uniref:DUF1684 domain-containing protein n=1 Tax=Salinilacihabitans rarus TaxID=2961596 RepID=UPI0020C83BC9|nr:DUF1684 domain-containing protein [Salinilacihabitans rarus]
MSDQWRARLLEARERKDEYFGGNPHSPIPDDERDSFDGLDYFEPDERYRFELPLSEHEEKETVVVGTSTGTEREYVRWGEFRFDLDGEELSLQAYKGDPDEERLWVPFRDATSGEETYGAGRYLDLEPDSHRTESGEWLLDFNEAYNPTCAYSDVYECPLPPTENWLDVPVEAGEKRYQ